MALRFVFGRAWAQMAAAATIVLVSLCGFAVAQPAAPPSDTSKYIIGPGDTLQISVWHNPELSTTAPVRPDGRISTPLVTDVVAAGRTSEELGHDIEARLKKYVSDPLVTVIVSSFIGPYNQQVRIVGEATTPKALPYLAHMTVLDAMISVGGLTPYASGNRAKLVRRVNGKEVETTLRISDLLKSGDLSANAELQPGDIIIIPQSFF
ncbi:MAG TPA: XrtA/PEP-CTERM system exopolysaccharide export protein [Rhizomicrobium sp.]|jgi:polysaccharide export outer membrane protein|nr:XrtA/PEP-CTERM system exopolysaccharide export protein [Rhizomicrobium sp.]